MCVNSQLKLKFVMEKKIEVIMNLEMSYDISRVYVYLPSAYLTFNFIESVTSSDVSISKQLLHSSSNFTFL